MQWLIIGWVIASVLMAVGGTIWVVYDAVQDDKRRGQSDYQ